MTVAKSKYYMLKVNFPKQAQIIDEEPLIDTHQVGQAAQDIPAE